MPALSCYSLSREPRGGVARCGIRGASGGWQGTPIFTPRAARSPALAQNRENWLRYQSVPNLNLSVNTRARPLSHPRGSSHGYASQQAARRGERGRQRRRRGGGRGWKRCRGLAGWWEWGRRANYASQRRAARASVARGRRGVRRRVPRWAPRRVAGTHAATAAGGGRGGRRCRRARTRAPAAARAGRGLPRPLPEGGARAPGPSASRCSGAQGARSAPR